LTDLDSGRGCQLLFHIINIHRFLPNSKRSAGHGALTVLISIEIERNHRQVTNDCCDEMVITKLFGISLREMFSFMTTGKIRIVAKVGTKFHKNVKPIPQTLARLLIQQTSITVMVCRLPFSFCWKQTEVFRFFISSVPYLYIYIETAAYL
jgi:hypothetical protein